MKILVTGAAGLLGSRLIHYLNQIVPDAEIWGVDNMEGGYDENLIGCKVKMLHVDANHLSLAKYFEFQRFDYVFCFHAYAAEGLSPFIRMFNYQNNLVSTANIINNCIEYGVKRLVFTSSMSVYGNGNPPFDEDSPYAPIDPYAVGKMACELDIKIAGEQHGLDWCIIRPHNVIGRNQNCWDKYRNVIGIFLYQSLNDLPLTIYGDGGQQRAFSPIEDCLPCLWRAAVLPEAGKQIINLGGTKHMTINQIADMVIRVTGKGTKVYLEGRHEVRDAFPTYQKSMDILGFREAHNIEDTIRDMWEWLQEQPTRERKVWDKYEVNKGIYSFWK